ncbi:hypothetical protein P3T16_004372 [Paraburkholderia sp. GAS42]
MRQMTVWVLVAGLLPHCQKRGRGEADFGST